MQGLEHVYRPGFNYSKSEILLLSLCQRGEFTDDLFTHSQPLAAETLMGVLDAVNNRLGRAHCAPLRYR